MGKLKHREGKARVTQGRRMGTYGLFILTTHILPPTCPAESAMERDRYMSPMEAQEFGLLDKVLVHPPQDGEDEPELVQKEPVVAAAEPAPAST